MTPEDEQNYGHLLWLARLVVEARANRVKHLLSINDFDFNELARLTNLWDDATNNLERWLVQTGHRLFTHPKGDGCPG